jgi:hypothetical protein
MIVTTGASTMATMARKQTTLALCAAGMIYGVSAVAQPEEQGPSDTLIFAPAPALPMPMAVFGGAVNVMGAEGNVPGAVVVDKPYSASSITESTQILADGNRISQRNEAKIYRDAAGRTRREHTLGGLGSWPVAGEPVTLINIHDPVADKSYSLDPTTRTAREFRAFRLALPPGGPEAEGRTNATWTAALPPPPPVPPGANVTVFHSDTLVTGTISAEGPVAGQSGIRVAAPGMPLMLAAPGPAEDLGSQVLEGLLVNGTRSTETIAAGALGNERPIEIVTERWYSPDIEAVVWQRHVDPRFGETNYRLVNVVRGEPSPDLFTVPQGYEVVAGPGPGPRLEIRRLEAPPPGGER